MNPLRYRGYVYDTETRFYYLQSRYYDPEIGRFLNADSYASTGQGILGNNMFAYCQNNPIVYVDPFGTMICCTFLGDAHILSDKYLMGGGGGYCGAGNRSIQASKRASEEIIKREIEYIKDGTYKQYFDYLQDSYAVVKFVNGIKYIGKGLGLSLLPNPTFITQAEGAAEVGYGLYLIVSALLAWTD